MAQERRRKREKLLQATEAQTEKVRRRVEDGRLEHFVYCRKAESIRREAVLNGVYVIRTNVPADALKAEGVVAGYKSLRQVELARVNFRLREGRFA